MNSSLSSVKISFAVKLRAYLELIRPANIITAFADVLAGFAIAGGFISFTGWELLMPVEGLGWLLLATFGLYGGGVVFNDVFDANLDAKERPERPIPGGRTSVREAALFGAALFFLGIASAFQVNIISGSLAIAIALCALMYDGWAKHYTVRGPLFMGLCRGGNLMLGVSIVPAALVDFWFLGFIPVLYIAAITLISQGEVHGGSKKAAFSSLIMLAIVFASLPGLTFYVPGYDLPAAGVFLILLGILIIPAFIRAAREPSPEHIRNAVKRGVISLIVLNAVFAAGFSGLSMGIIVLILLPLSLLFGRLFAVT